MRTLLRLPILALALAVAASGCDSPTPLAPQGESGMSGRIVARDSRISTGGHPTMHVKETPAEECGVIFSISDDTRILRRVSSHVLIEVPVSELVVGANVRVWTGAVLRSCPGQAHADIIEIS
jgi:hypothetical protein